MVNEFKLLIRVLFDSGFLQIIYQLVCDQMTNKIIETMFSTGPGSAGGKGPGMVDRLTIIKIYVFSGRSFQSQKVKYMTLPPVESLILSSKLKVTGLLSRTTIRDMAGETEHTGIPLPPAIMPVHHLSGANGTCRMT